jgi:hypothetical protein
VAGKSLRYEEVWRQVTDFNANEPSSSTEIQRTRRLNGKATAQKLYLKTVNESKLKSSTCKINVQRTAEFQIKHDSIS